VAPGYRDTTVNITSKALFEPSRYAGTWYEIASYPTQFQRGCTKTTATYAVQADGSLSVFNTCDVNGEEKAIAGTATLTGPGRLEVQFSSVPFVKAPYWVLWVDEDYQTAVVGVPSGRAGWILNRTPTLRADRLQAAKDILKFNGYDLSQLRMTPQ
jgi:apolipoprotein D and lipocalin family protein